MWRGVCLSSVLLILAALPVRGAEVAKTYEDTVAKAIQFLASQQGADGSYGAAASPAVTAIITCGVLRQGRAPQDPVVAKSLKYLESFVQPDGGIYKEGTNYKNYETCLAVLCFTEANKDGRYDEATGRGR